MPAFFIAALTILPQLIKFGMDVEPLIASMLSIAKGADPTDADWATLHTAENALRARLDDTSKDTR